MLLAIRQSLHIYVYHQHELDIGKRKRLYNKLWSVGSEMRIGHSTYLSFLMKVQSDRR